MKKKLQVFVSSTYSDLLAERQAAVSAILKSGNIPAGMELFTAGDKSQLETIKSWIDESDVYMLILGGRYGSIEPNSGLSYTEFEFDYASQLGKPFFSVVISEKALEEKVKAYGTSVIEKDNSKALSDFRIKVLSNISSFFDDEKDIRLCVHESLADIRDKANVKGWVSADEVEDTKPLYEEITRLRQENSELTSRLDALMRSAKNSSRVSEDFGQLIELLTDHKIKIPSSLAGGKEDVEVPLLSLVLNQKDDLINGVTNAYNAGEREVFLYYSVCPKLIIHGLVANEKVPAVRYRRSFVTAKGLEFFAELERRAKRKRFLADGGTGEGKEVALKKKAVSKKTGLAGDAE